jgi:hypothetical protein
MEPTPLPAPLALTSPPSPPVEADQLATPPDPEPAAIDAPAEPMPASRHVSHVVRYVAPRTALARQAAPPSVPPAPYRPNGNGAGSMPEGDEGAIERGATAPQLRRFIKSRAYVPMHELRRRFAINSADDDVTPVDLERRRVFVGLPEREGRLLGELLRGGDIGFELSLDPITPIVVGVYPMRPVTRA